MNTYKLILKAPHLRFDAKTKKSGKPNCTGKNTAPCGAVCRQPKNCNISKREAGRLRKVGASDDDLKKAIEIKRAGKKLSDLETEIRGRLKEVKAKVSTGRTSPSKMAPKPREKPPGRKRAKAEPEKKPTAKTPDKVSKDAPSKKKAASKPQTTAKKKSTKIPQKKPFGKIETYKEGRKLLVDTIRDVDKQGNYGGTVIPIYQVRRALGDKLSRSQFNDYLIELQGDDAAYLSGGAIEDGEVSKLRDSVTAPTTGLKTFVTLESNADEVIRRPVPRAQEKELRDAIEKRYEVENTTEIKDSKSFGDVAEAVFNRLNHEFGLDSIMEIGRIREELKGKVSDAEFDDYVRDLQDRGYELGSSGRSHPGGISGAAGYKDQITRYSTIR